MKYKGYTAKIELDEEAGIFHGYVINTKDVITFQGTSVDELKQSFAESVDFYLEMCAESGQEPDKPFSGTFNVRIEPECHRAIAVAASQRNESLNHWVCRVLRDAIPPSLVGHIHQPEDAAGLAYVSPVTTLTRRYTVEKTVEVPNGNAKPAPQSSTRISRPLGANRMAQDFAESVFSEE